MIFSVSVYTETLIFLEFHVTKYSIFLHEVQYYFFSVYTETVEKKLIIRYTFNMYLFDSNSKVLGNLQFG